MSFIPWWVHYPNVNNEILNLDWLLKVSNCNTNKIENFINLNTIKYADPILWNIESQYEANTVVVDGQTGNAYISIKAVPSGVHLNRTEYWTQIYNYADELHVLRNEIAFDEGNTTTASKSFAINDLVFVNGQLYRVISAMIAGDSFVVDSNVVNTSIDDELKRLRAADTQIQTNLNNTNQTLNDEIVNREAADDYLHGLIDDEVNNRSAADDYLHGLIDAETNNRTLADDYLHRLLNPNGHVYMFVGDSYAEAHYAWESNVEGWPNYCKNYLNLSNDQFLANYAGATGFCTSNKWYDMINDYVVPEGVEVTDIVIGGGYNDKDYSINTIMTAIANCAAMIRTKYPSARVWLCFMGWDCRDAQWQGLMQAKSAYIQGAGANGWNYIENVDWLGHNYTDGAFYTTTGDTPFGSNFHPNNNGNKSIARAISTVLRGGQFEDFKVLESCDLTAVAFDSNTATPSYDQLYASCVNGVMSLFSKHTIEVNYSTPITITGNGSLIPIGQLASGLLHGDANEQTICPVVWTTQVSTESAVRMGSGFLVLKGNVLYVKYYSISNSQWSSLSNVFRITLQLFEQIGIDRTRI